MPPSLEPDAREQRWIDALVDRYFSTDFADRPVYLAVDVDELELLADEIDDTPGGLLEIVRQNLDPRGDPYMTYKRRWDRWSGDRAGSPPYLCLIAACVLAASDMGRDESQGVSANDFYTRLADRLDLDHSRAETEFGTLAGMWVSLGEWLEQDQAGARGNPMIEAPTWFTNIGWPVSQSIFRAVDRYRLPDCFVAAELSPGDEVTDEQLFEKVKRWSQAGYRFTPRATRMVANATGKIEQQLREIVAREFEQWDGTLRDKSGRKRGVVHLAMFSQVGRTHFEFRPSRPLGFPDAFAQTFPTTVTLRPAFPEFYESLPHEVDEKSLTDGIRLKMPRFSLAFTPQPVIPMAESMAIEGWLSVPRVTADQPHAILVRSDFVDSVTRYLSDAALGLTPAPSKVKSLPNGWTIFRQVSFKPEASTEVPELRCLVPRSDLTSQLIGGLKLSRKDPVYLCGCEPRIALSSAEREVGHVEVDGILRKLDGGTLDLSTLGLEPGAHEVVTGDITRRFRTVDSLGEHSIPVEPAIAHRIEMPSRRPIGNGASDVTEIDHLFEESRIVGAYSEYEERPDLLPVFVRTGGNSYIALGTKPGEITRFESHVEPLWLNYVVPPKSQRAPGWQGLLETTRDFDAYLEFEAAWFVSILGDQHVVIAGTKAAASIERGGDAAAVQDWSETICSLQGPAAASHAAIWATYRRVAESALTTA